MALCLGTYGDPMGVGVSYERGTPVALPPARLRPLVQDEPSSGRWIDCIRTLQLLYRNVERFRGGLVVKARRLLYHSALGLRVIKRRERTLHRAQFTLRGAVGHLE